MHHRITIKEQCLCRNSHAKGLVQFMNDGEADKEMSDSLMNDMADAMRSNGKIYVVVGVLLIILMGLFIYLFSMDKKIRKIEQRTTLKN